MGEHKFTTWLEVYLDMDALLQEGRIEAARRRLHQAAQDAAIGKIRERQYREVVGARDTADTGTGGDRGR